MIEVSGTLHLYSGHRRELFFVFDDDVAHRLYEMRDFKIDDEGTRRVWVSVGLDRFISQRTLSFSKKQTEIKVSLCSRGSKDGLRALTSVYDWFVPNSDQRPSPFPVLGILQFVAHGGAPVWELCLQEPTGLVVPPGFERREKSSKAMVAWRKRRKIQDLELKAVGRLAEQLAVDVAAHDFPAPKYECLWRDGYLDSERIEVRQLGLIADIDIWDSDADQLTSLIEVKAQKVTRSDSSPCFYLSWAEWRSYRTCHEQGISFQLWLFQYREREHFENARGHIKLFVLDTIREEWLLPDDTYLVKPTEGSGTYFDIHDG